MAHVLKAAEGHVADGDVRTGPAHLPARDRPDPLVVLVVPVAAPRHDPPSSATISALDMPSPSCRSNRVGSIYQPAVGIMTVSRENRSIAELCKKRMEVKFPGALVPLIINHLPERIFHRLLDIQYQENNSPAP